MEKVELKAREDEIAKMVTEFCNGKSMQSMLHCVRRWYASLVASAAILLKEDVWKYGQQLLYTPLQP